MLDAYKVGALYDGISECADGAKYVLVENGIFTGTAAWPAEKRLRKQGYSFHDLSRFFLLPGLIDAHVHITLPGNGACAEDFYARSDTSSIFRQAAENAGFALRSGITTVRDCGAVPDIVFRLKREIETGSLSGADLLTCGSSMTVPGGHTHFFQGAADTAKETIRLIRRMREQGADFVKLIATGGGTRGVVQYAQMLSNAQLRAACEEAHKLGTYATAHVCTTATAKSAVNSGVDMMEHLIFADETNSLAFDEQLAETIARREIPVCITMAAINVSLLELERPGRKLTKSEQEERDMLARFKDTIYEGFRRTARNIRYVPGTDAGWRRSGFDSLYACMEPMAQLGYSNLEVLHAATGGAAAALRLPHKGAIAAGRQADFIILDGNPLWDLQQIRHPRMVFKRGQNVYTRAE